MKSEIVINASNISPNVLLWLKRGDNGYFIERRVNKQGTTSQYFNISGSRIEKWKKLSTEDAWKEMERYLRIID